MCKKWILGLLTCTAIVHPGCDAFNNIEEECLSPILCFEDNDGDGLGLELKVIWACPEKVPPGFAPIPGDMCEDDEAINWNNVPYEGCRYENEECVSIEYFGTTYDVVQIGWICCFAQDLVTTKKRNGSEIIEVTDPADYTDEGFFRHTTYPEQGYLYGIDLLFPTNQLCPSGWYGMTHDMLESSLDKVAKYTNVGKGIKKNGFWENETGDYWGFGVVPNGVFHKNFGYMFGGSLAAHWAITNPGYWVPDAIWSIDLFENDVIQFETFEDSYFGVCPPELRASRCWKPVF